MSADVVCMSLGSVPPGEQRSRFLAVGLTDQTVRIISLDPSVSCLWNTTAGCSSPVTLPCARVLTSFSLTPAHTCTTLPHTCTHHSPSHLHIPLSLTPAHTTLPHTCTYHSPSHLHTPLSLTPAHTTLPHTCTHHSPSHLLSVHLHTPLPQTCTHHSLTPAHTTPSHLHTSLPHTCTHHSLTPAHTTPSHLHTPLPHTCTYHSLTPAHTTHSLYTLLWRASCMHSLVTRPFKSPVFDRLQYARVYCKLVRVIEGL